MVRSLDILDLSSSFNRAFTAYSHKDLPLPLAALSPSAHRRLLICLGQVADPLVAAKQKADSESGPARTQVVVIFSFGGGVAVTGQC